MSMTQCFGRARFSMLLIGALLGACGDDGDSGSDEQAQSSDAGDSTATQGSRAGTMAAARGGRGGNAANNTASAGRSGGAGRVAASGGRGGTAANGGSAASNPTTGGANAPVPDAGSTSPTSDEDAGPSAPLNLTDAQIASVLSNVNTAETSAGTYALTRATSLEVRAYAQSMVEMHSAAQERQTAIFGALNLTLTPSVLSTQLADESAANLTQLMSLSDAELETAYLRTQLDAHTEVLTLIDVQLLPSVVADTLRAELVLTRTQVATHIDAARTAIAALALDTDAGVAP